MPPRFLRLALLCFLVLGSTGWAKDDPPSAADVTESGWGLDRPLDIVLAGSADADAARTLVVVVDPSPELRRAGFVPAWRRAVRRQRRHLANTEIGLVVLGEPKDTVVSPTDDLDAVDAALAEGLRAPVRTFRDPHAAVIDAAGLLSGQRGDRQLLLVTMENSDVEGNVERAVHALDRAKATCVVLTQEAFVADTWWLQRRDAGQPRGTTLSGGDSAFIDLPWGWLFQRHIANEIAPSGFAPYGMNRLAAASGGRVFLYAPPTASGHSCDVYGGCPFCAGDHVPRGEAYESSRLRALAPGAGSRPEELRRAGGDPGFRALLEAWTKASKAELLRSRPSVKASGGGLKPERRLLGTSPHWATGLSLSSNAKRAERLAAEARQIADGLQADLDGAEGHPRHRAAAEYAHAMLRLTEINLRLFAAWCREIGPVWIEGQGEEVMPPEVPRYPESMDARVVGIAYGNLCLCHGVRRFLEVRLAKDEAIDRQLEDLDDLVVSFLDRHAGTPYAFALRRAGIATFSFSVRSREGTPPPRRRRGDDDDPVVTPPDRPSGGSDPGRTGGPVTGGG